MGTSNWKSKAMNLGIGFAMLLGLTTNAGAGNVTIEKTTFEGWQNAYHMSNGEVELVAVADIGPRILQFNRVGEENLFNISEGTKGDTGGDKWKGYGGHRFWIAPESLDYTYYPDNTPVKVEVDGNTLTLTGLPEIHDEDLRQQVTTFDELVKRMDDNEFKSKLGVQKKMIVTLQEDGEVVVDHEAYMHSKSMHIAPWALTVMEQKGLAIIPNPPYAPHGPGHFLPVRNIVIWSYTDLTDPRLEFRDDYVTIKQNPNAKKPYKIGFSDTQGWAGYALKNQFFVKQLDQKPDAIYPDMNSAVEIFTNSGIMEIESLGLQVNLEPGDSMHHRERWRIHEIDPIDGSNESINRIVENAGLK